MANKTVSDKWVNTLDWVGNNPTYVSVVKEDDGVVWYKFVEKDSIQKEIGAICDGFIVSVIESRVDDSRGVFSHAIFLYDDGEMMTVVLSVFDSHVRVPLISIMEAMNVKVISLH